MPIYKSEEMDEVLARVREKFVRQGIPLDPVLAEAEVRAFEEAWGVTLPEAYRRYLLEVGNGFEWENGYPFLVFPPEEGAERLSAPFPFEEAWVWEAEDGEPDPEKWEALKDGNLELIDIGCGQTFNLIVTGSCRGEVWWFADVGIQPCCQRQDFLGWLEKWLDDGDDADYFAEYPD